MARPFYPVGRYLCQIKSQALGETSKGNPQLVLRFLVLGQINPADPGGALIPHAQYERNAYRVINENTIEYAVKDLKALGYTRQSFKYLDPAVPDHHSFVGQQVEMYCGHREYNGEMKEEWSVAMQGSEELKVNPLGSKKSRQLDNLFGKHLKTLVDGAPPQEPARAHAVTANPAIDDDGIPF
jgi:hypothetical protein